MGFLDIKIKFLLLAVRVINIPCLPNSSSHPLSIIISMVWEVFNGKGIIPWEVRGYRNHIVLLNRNDKGAGILKASSLVVTTKAMYTPIKVIIIGRSFM